MSRREPTVLLHVGAVPTASGLIQRCLLRNAELWNQSRTYGLPDAIMAAELGSGKKLSTDPDAFATTLHTLFAGRGADVVAGSRELLGPAFGGPPGSGLHPEADPAILALAEATRQYRRAIVLSVCPQSQLLEMHYARAINAGRAGDADEWLASVDLDNLSWLPLHRKLSEAFGVDAVTVHDFRSTARGHISFLRHVFAAAELELPKVVADKVPPPRLRLSDTGVRLTAAATSLLASRTERNNLQTFVRRNFSELDGPPATVLTTVQSDALHELYDREFALLLRGATDGEN